MADEETEIQVQENAPPERPDWLPSNFDKPEDLAKSYSHAASKITEQGQELAALRSQIEEIQASQTQYQTERYGNDLEQQLYDAYESGDGRSIAAANAYLIKQAQEQLKAELLASQPAPQSIPTEMTVDYAERSITAKYPDWPEYRAKAGEIVQNDPILSQALSTASSPSAVAATLETAYKLARFESGVTASADAAEKLDEINRATKNAAQTMTGTNASTESESYWDRVKAAQSGIPRFSL